MEAAALTVDDLLNFNFDEDSCNQDEENTQKASLSSPSPSTDDPLNQLGPPEFAEEDLEWLSNKDAFPSLDSCLDILSENPSIGLNHQSPVSVLDTIIISNNNKTSNGLFMFPLHYPVKPRSSRRQRRRRSYFPDPPTHQFILWDQDNNNAKESHSVINKIARKCSHCLSEKTPQWRAGPLGPKTLCNACGVRYKSGRLCPEYRPANSPTFSGLLHSNFHRKVVDMRKRKELVGMILSEPRAYSIG